MHYRAAKEGCITESGQREDAENKVVVLVVGRARTSPEFYSIASLIPCALISSVIRSMEIKVYYIFLFRRREGSSKRASFSSFPIQMCRLLHFFVFLMAKNLTRLMKRAELIFHLVNFPNGILHCPRGGNFNGELNSMRPRLHCSIRVIIISRPFCFPRRYIHILNVRQGRLCSFTHAANLEREISVCGIPMARMIFTTSRFHAAWIALLLFFAKKTNDRVY